MSNTRSVTKSLFSQRKEVRTNKGPARQKMPTVEKRRFALFLKGHRAGLGQAVGRMVELSQRGAFTSRNSDPEAVLRFIQSTTGFPRYPKGAYSYDTSRKPTWPKAQKQSPGMHEINRDKAQVVTDTVQNPGG